MCNRCSVGSHQPARDLGYHQLDRREEFGDSGIPCDNGPALSYLDELLDVDPLLDTQEMEALIEGDTEVRDRAYADAYGDDEDDQHHDPDKYRAEDEDDFDPIRDEDDIRMSDFADDMMARHGADDPHVMAWD